MLVSRFMPLMHLLNLFILLPVGWFLLTSPLVHAEVKAMSNGECFNPQILTQKLEQLIAVKSPNRKINIHLSFIGDGDPANTKWVEVTMVESSTRRILLKRDYTFKPADCASAPELIYLVVDRFLERLPIKDIPPGNSTPSPLLEVLAPTALLPNASMNGSGISLLVAGSAQVDPWGLETEIGGTIDWAVERHRLGLGSLIRAAFPHQLAEGHYQETALLFMINWRYLVNHWQTSLELRSGPLIITGYGYEMNHTRVIPWLETVGSLERQVGHGRLGLFIGFAPWPFQAVTEDGLNTQSISRYRLGLRFTVPLFINKN